MIDPERKLFYTACEKMVTIWDLISLETKGILKCHRDEVRVIHNHGDYLFTGGKGTPNGGSLLIWDLRKLNPNQALEEK
jgi:WD40 repeat protein